MEKIHEIIKAKHHILSVIPKVDKIIPVINSCTHNYKGDNLNYDEADEFLQFRIAVYEPFCLFLKWVKKNDFKHQCSISHSHSITIKEAYDFLLKTKHSHSTDEEYVNVYSLIKEAELHTKAYNAIIDGIREEKYEWFREGMNAEDNIDNFLGALAWMKGEPYWYVAKYLDSFSSLPELKQALKQYRTPYNILGRITLSESTRLRPHNPNQVINTSTKRKIKRYCNHGTDIQAKPIHIDDIIEKETDEFLSIYHSNTQLKIYSQELIDLVHKGREQVIPYNVPHLATYTAQENTIGVVEKISELLQLHRDEYGNMIVNCIADMLYKYNWSESFLTVEEKQILNWIVSRTQYFDLFSPFLKKRTQQNKIDKNSTPREVEIENSDLYLKSCPLSKGQAAKLAPLLVEKKYIDAEQQFHFIYLLHRHYEKGKKPDNIRWHASVYALHYLFSQIYKGKIERGGAQIIANAFKDITKEKFQKSKPSGDKDEGIVLADIDEAIEAIQDI